MQAIATPMRLAMVMLMEKPRVNTKIPRSNTTGVVSPKFCSYFSQLKAVFPAASCPRKPPNTTPTNIKSKSAHPFFPAILLPILIPLFVKSTMNYYTCFLLFLQG